MEHLQVDLILTGRSSDPVFNKPMRILLIADSYVWMIPVDVGPHRGYAKGVQRFREDLVKSWIGQSKLDLTEFKPPAQWALPDEDINQLYGKRAGEPCKAIIQREAAWNAIQAYVEAHPVSEAVLTMSYRTWIPTRAAELGCSVSWLYHVLHLYWAGGSTRFCLLGNSRYCGSPGVRKAQSTKLGRRNVATSAALRADPATKNLDSVGYIMSLEAINKAQFGWRHFSAGRSVRQAYLETMATFYRDSIKMVGGMPEAVLKLPNDRPTQRQFEYWGPRDESKHEVDENKNRQDQRRLPGYANQNILKIGQIAWADSSSGDVELTSVVSRLIHVSSATFLELMDARTTVICGVYIGFERPSARIALLAAAHAAMSKADWCARFGFEGITDDQIPAVRLDNIYTDNGEYRNILSAKVTLEAWQGWITYAPAGVPEEKGTIEGDHHVRHKLADHKLAGTTHGRPRCYGEPEPASEAALNIYEYTRIHIERILRHNTQQAVPHLLTGEMRGELDASATRMDIFRWLKKHGYINGTPPSSDVIRAHMLPTFDATMTARGVFVHRPDRGNKPEFLIGCRFVSDYLVQSGMLAAARKHGVSVRLKMDPTDLQVAWLPTAEGLQLLNNVYADDLLIARGSVNELCVIQDGDARVRLKDKARQDQDDLDYINNRENINRSAVEQKIKERTAAKASEPDRNSSSHTPSERRQTEIGNLEERGLASPIDVSAPAASSEEAVSAVTTPSTEVTATENKRSAYLIDDTVSAIRKFKQRTNRS